MLDEHKKYIDYQFDSVCLLENPIALIKVDGSHDHLNSLHQMSFNVCDQCCREPTIVHEMHVVQQFNMVIGRKTSPEKTHLYHFHAEKALFKGPNFAV